MIRRSEIVLAFYGPRTSQLVTIGLNGQTFAKLSSLFDLDSRKYATFFSQKQKLARRTNRPKQNDRGKKISRLNERPSFNARGFCPFDVLIR